MTDPTERIGLAQQHLRVSVADSAAFRTWVGATTQTQALSRVHHVDLPVKPDGREYTRAELEAARPFAIVFTEPHAGFRSGLTAHGLYAQGGQLWLVLEQDVPPEIADNVPEIYVRFTETVGAILRQLEELAITAPAGHLAIRETVVYGPERADEDERIGQGDYIRAWLEIHWGQ